MIKNKNAQALAQVFICVDGIDIKQKNTKTKENEREREKGRKSR